jgi:hypothetical protein
MAKKLTHRLLDMLFDLDPERDAKDLAKGAETLPVKLKQGRSGGDLRVEAANVSATSLGAARARSSSGA